MLAGRMGLAPQVNTVHVLFGFMHSVVVRFKFDLERPRRTRPGNEGGVVRYTCERALDSYFHLYHLLLCLTTGPDGPAVVAVANRLVTSFLAGRSDKKQVPNLAYLLSALLVSDIAETEMLKKYMACELVARNVVWLLDGKGAACAELGFME